jgi:hypothetical protein
MAWDDDPEEKAGSVARAFIGSDEGETPEEPSVQNADEGPQDEPSPAGADSSEYMGQNQEQAPSAPRELPSDPGEEEAAISPGQGEGYSAVPIGTTAAEEDNGEDQYFSKPLQAPKMPTFAPYVQSQAPGQLAAAKSAFTARVANAKPSIGRRIGASIAAGLQSFGGVPGAETAAQRIYDAPLDRARAAETQKEAGIQAQIDADNAANAVTQRNNQAGADQYNMAERDMRNRGYVQNQEAQAAQRTAQAARLAGQVRPETLKPDDPNDPVNGTWSGVNARGEKVTGLAAPDAYLKTPAGKAAVVEDTIKRARAAGHPFTPEQESVVRSGGHVTIKNPTNIHVPSAGSAELAAANAAFRLQYGRGPRSMEEANQIVQTAKGELGKGANSNPAQVIVDSAKQYADKLQRVDADHASSAAPEGSYVPVGANLENVKNGDLTGIKVVPGQQYEDTLRKFRDQVRQHGGEVDEDWNLKQPNAGPAAASPQVAKPKTATFAQSEIPKNTALPAGSVWVKAPNGTIGHIPQANLDKAVKRGYATLGSQ